MWFIGVEVEQETSAPPPKKKSWIRPCYSSLRAKRSLRGGVDGQFPRHVKCRSDHPKDLLRSKF